MKLLVDKLEIRLPHYRGLCSLHQAQYTNGAIALQLISIPDGKPGNDFPEPVATCTVCLPEASLESTEVIIKSWSENEGMVLELQRHGAISPIKRFISTGYVTATVHDLLKKLP